MRARVLAAIACAALWFGPGEARASDLDEDFQVWSPVVLQFDIGQKVLRGWVELQPRFDADAGRLGVLLWRPALGVYLHEWVTLWGGYAFVERLRPAYAAEHRVWEQLQVAGALDEEKRIKVLGRLRMEHRLRQGADPVAHRLRLLLRGQVSLIEPAPPSVYLLAWNEVFLGFNTVEWIGQPSGFDRNRAFVGLGVQVLEQLRVEAGYMLEVVRRRGPADELGNHVLALTVWIDL